MKWKNGKGETFEIAKFPEEGPFLWRLSMAPVLDNGPFSKFPGFDRYLVVVEGKGLKLGDKILGEGDLIRFSGDEFTYGELTQGKILDFNLIYNREKVRVNYEILEETGSILTKGKISFLFALKGKLIITDGESEIELNMKDTLQFNVPLKIVKKDLKSSFVLIDLHY
jgi:environmental stress-induced protein Ves